MNEVIKIPDGIVCDHEVLECISDTIKSLGEPLEVLTSKFTNGDHYMFALMMELAFWRGNVCLSIPELKVAWRDDDGIIYTIEGAAPCNSNIVLADDWGCVGDALNESATYLDDDKWKELHKSARDRTRKL